MSDETNLGNIQDFIRIHKVCYEVWPEFSYISGAQRQVGFVIELCGVHEHPEHVSPGCHECHLAHERLTKIANSVIPGEETDSRYPVDSFLPSIHYPPKRRMRGEVQVTIRIAHKQDYLAPLDECERNCLDEIERSLNALGVHRGSYIESQA